MLNSVGPILVLVISIAMLRKAPERGQIIGLIVGLSVDSRGIVGMKLRMQ